MSSNKFLINKKKINNKLMQSTPQLQSIVVILHFRISLFIMFTNSEK